MQFCGVRYIILSIALLSRFIIVSTLVDAILNGFSGIFYIREDAYSPPFNSTLFLLINSYSLSKTSYVLRQG
jgi:hypothetical protein